MKDELIQYNNLVKEYKEYYFNVYSFLVSKGWIEFEPCENSNDELWFDWLVSPELYELYQTKEDIYVIDVIENEGDKFDVDISNCTSIFPPTSFVCTININNNPFDIIKHFISYKFDFFIKKDTVLLNNNWYEIKVEDINSNYSEESNETDYLVLYINPDLNKEVAEAFITKDNVYDLLKHWPDYIVNSDIWWNYEQT
jgi:hypothetical protein